MTTIDLTDLTDFLLARIAERESEAYLLGNGPAWFVQAVVDGESFPVNEAARRVDECKALRRLVEGMRDDRIDDINAPEVLGLLALPYADHEDFREEWRP